VRRIAVVIVGLCALVGVFLFAVRPADDPVVRSGPAALETAALAPVAAKAKPRETVHAMFSRTTYGATQLAGSDALLDACRGPVAVDLGPDRPVLVAEHDYCGGSAWIPRLAMGDAVKLSGDGLAPGLYRVSDLRYPLRHQTRVSDLPGTEIADAVLQTCISKTTMVLVGLQRVDS
jgi:hypothetical protein